MLQQKLLLRNALHVPSSSGLCGLEMCFSSGRDVRDVKPCLTVSYIISLCLVFWSPHGSLSSTVLGCISFITGTRGNTSARMQPLQVFWYSGIFRVLAFVRRKINSPEYALKGSSTIWFFSGGEKNKQKNIAASQAAVWHFYLALGKKKLSKSPPLAPDSWLVLSIPFSSSTWLGYKEEEEVRASEQIYPPLIWTHE